MHEIYSQVPNIDYIMLGKLAIGRPVAYPYLVDPCLVKEIVEVNVDTIR